MRALVVDDDQDSLDLVEAVLSGRGHEVVAKSDGASALSAYEAAPFPLVVLDWMMPGMDGLELCRRIRELPGGDRTIILAITARSEPESLGQLLDAGANDYLAKPFDPRVLSVRIAVAEQTSNNLIERKRAEEHLQTSSDDMLAILNALRVGTAITDEVGVITFSSKSAQAILGRSADAVVGRPWREGFPIDDAAAIALNDAAARPWAERTKVGAEVERDDGTHASIEIDIGDDPRDSRKKLFFFYDVSDVHQLRKKLDERAHFKDLVGKSKRMREVYQYIRDVAPVDSTALILGETGTGKELVARAIHTSSRRAAGALIPVNCAGLTESILTSQLFGHRRGAFTGADEDRIGLFEAATGGTIFLDELGDIPMSVQTALLRVLQEREIVRVGETAPRKIDVRVIAATHRDLNHEVEQGSFRQDLLYRLRVVTIRLPPLRERREDIPLLADSVMAELRATTGKPVNSISHEAMRILIDFDWPGNVRELKSVLESAMIRCRGTIIQPEDLPTEIFEMIEATPITGEGLDERGMIQAALEQAGGNRTTAAKILGISRATFYRRLNALGIEA